MPGEPNADERAGQLIGGRYRIVDRLGAGGFGRVWKAHDQTLGVDVAVKEVWLPPAISRRDQDERLTRAQREARSAARLRDHPNIVGVHDVVIHDDAPWTVMQLVAGRSLEEHVRLYGPLSPQHVATLARALLKALGAAHAAGIVHRDVKPANVMLSDEGEVLLTDFGIAVQQADTALTATGAFIGSVEYIAPERARGTDGLPGSDLFSLGVTLYHALEGISPFLRDTPTGTLTALLFEEAPPPTRAGALAPLIGALLEKDPDKRTTNAQALALVEQAAQTNPVPAPETQVAQMPPTMRIDASQYSGSAALAVAPLPAPPSSPPAAALREVLPPQAAAATVSAAPADTDPTIARPSASVVAVSAPVRGRRLVPAATVALSILAGVALTLPAWNTYYRTGVLAGYIYDDQSHSFPLAIIAMLCLAAMVAILARLATVRAMGLRVTGYLCGAAGLVYWLYRLVSLQDLGRLGWLPFSSDYDHLGAGMWLMILAAAGLTALYIRREQTTRRALEVRLHPARAVRLSQRSSVAGAAGVAVLIVVAILLPSRQRYGFALKTYAFMQDYDSSTVPHQFLWIALALTFLTLVALCLLPRIKSRTLRGAPYVLACLSAVCWTYQLTRLHDYNVRYRGENEFGLGLGAWLMVLATIAALALYGWREATTRSGKGAPPSIPQASRY